MDHDRFVRLVKLSASISAEDADRVIASTLRTLAERLGQDDAGALAGKVPEELAPCLSTRSDPRAFGADEFLLRAGAPAAPVRAVLSALRLAVGDDQWSALVAELSPDYGSLLAPVDGIAAPDFVARIGDERATEAALQTLAERLAGDAVEDLIAKLPIQFRTALRRGKPDRDAPATRLTVEDFVGRIAERTGTTADEAILHARSFFAALRDTLAEKDFYNVVSPLPLDYSVLLPRP